MQTILNQENMTCADCPYIKSEFDARKAYFEKYDKAKESGSCDMPMIAKSCYCDKVGGKLGLWGYCMDAESYDHHIDECEYMIYESSDRVRRRKRRAAVHKYKQRLKFYAKNVTGCPRPSVPVDATGRYVDSNDEAVYYKRIYKSGHTGQYRSYKKSANRRVRRYFDADDIKSLGRARGSYKKVG